MIFQVEAEFKVKDKLGYVVKLPYDCNDFDWLLGTWVALIDKSVVIFGKVSGVERFTHCPPWRKGETISLVLD